jgi:hemin uptake protein HemP
MCKPDTQSPVSKATDMPTPQGNQLPPRETGAPAEAIPSSQLFQNRREVTISHDGSLYRLRITRQGKLILNK